MHNAEQPNFETNTHSAELVIDRQKVIDTVVAAVRTALSSVELQKVQDQERALIRQFIKAEVGRGKLDEGAEFLNHNAGLAIFDTPEECTFALGYIGLESQQIEAMIAHEMAHYKADVAQGLMPKLGLRFSKGEDGLHITPCVRTGYDNSLSEERMRQYMMESLEAPEVLSDSDRQKLGLEHGE